jgi:hypothetical protein
MHRGNSPLYSITLSINKSSCGGWLHRPGACHYLAAFADLEEAGGTGL